MTLVDDIAFLSDLIGRSNQILVFTGAGVSTGSGIPDYRGPQGVWKTRTPVFYDEFMSSEAARRRYWGQKLEDREALLDARPNDVHASLVELERSGRLEALVTQNVDGLHAVAGTSPERLIELHGTTRFVECQRCGRRTDPEEAFTFFATTGEAPRCGCGGPLKPATISFGQSLKDDGLERAFTAARRCDLALALGSTLSVTPAASVPLAAAERGVPYVIVNQGPTEHDRSRFVRLRLEGDVAQIVPPAIRAAIG